MAKNARELPGVYVGWTRARAGRGEANARACNVDLVIPRAPRCSRPRRAQRVRGERRGPRPAACCETAGSNPALGNVPPARHASACAGRSASLTLIAAPSVAPKLEVRAESSPSAPLSATSSMSITVPIALPWAPVVIGRLQSVWPAARTGLHKCRAPAVSMTRQLTGGAESGVRRLIQGRMQRAGGQRAWQDLVREGAKCTLSASARLAEASRTKQGT